MITHAQWVTPVVRQWLQSATAVRLLHIFERACNLVDARGRVLSLVTADLGPGPFAVTLPPGCSLDRAITAETPVTVEDEAICLGAWRVETTGANLWNPRPDWATVRQRIAGWRPILPKIEDMINERQRQMGIIAIGKSRFVAAAQTFLRGITARDVPASQEGARRLAGLGPGLTPAGDDFLLGALYGLWATQPQAAVIPLAQMVVETAAPRTTTLSAAWLQAAARGEAAAPWHDLGTRSDWQTAVQRILLMGHTSGADALAAFTAVCLDRTTSE